MSMTIGQVASAAGVNVETIRYYERRGLLRQPTPGTGYRRYGDEHLWRLRFIKRAKAFGFTLAEIAELLAASSPADVTAAALARAFALEGEIARLDERRRRLQQLIEVCSANEAKDEYLNLEPRSSCD